MARSTTHKTAILATLSVLSVNDKPIDSETLTVACFKAFSSLFSMDLFKEYPRYDRVQRRIYDLIENGLLTEVHQNKYVLTDKGKEWQVHNSTRINHASKILTSNKDLILTQNMSEQELSMHLLKLKHTTAYKKHNDDKDKITIADFMDFLRIDVYSTKALFDRKMKKIMSICQHDDELKSLFNFMSEKFGKDFSNFKEKIDEIMRDK